MTPNYSCGKINEVVFMTKVHSTSLKILILGMACFPYIIFPDHIDDEIIKYAALAKRKQR